MLRIEARAAQAASSMREPRNRQCRAEIACRV